jgi:hypothetical protein
MTKDAKMRRILAALACAGLIVAFASTLARERNTLAGSNTAPPKAPVAQLQAGQTACQHGVLIPAGVKGLRLGARTNLGAPTPGPGVSARILVGGTVISRGSLKAGYAENGSVSMPVTPIDGTHAGSTVCVHNDGPVRMEFYGATTAAGTPLTVAGKPTMAVLTLIFDGKRESWASSVPTIAHHADTGGTQVFGSLTLWLAAAFVLAAGLGAVYLTLREGDA